MPGKFTSFDQLTDTVNFSTSSGQSSLPPPSVTKAASSLFPSSSQPQQSSGGLFGSSSQPQSTGSIFGSTSQSQPAGSLFGNTSQPQTAGGLFGSTSQPQSTGSLFGNTSQPQQSGSIFGLTGKNQQQQGGAQSSQGTGGGLFGTQQNQQSTGGLFGTSNAQQTQPQQSTGLFASLGQNQAQQPQSTLFGGMNNQSKTSSLFSNTQNPSQNQQATMPPPVRPSIFSSQIGQYAQQQQTVPGVRISYNELRSTTRFNDLHEDAQKEIEAADNFILRQIGFQQQCQGANERIDNLVQQLPPDVEYCTKSLDTMQQALENDAESIAFAKSLVKADWADANLSFRAIQNQRLPPQYHQSSLWITPTSHRSLGPSIPSQAIEDGASSNIVDYFSKGADEMTMTLDTYKRNISEVENYLRGIESSTMQQMQQMVFSRGREGGEKNAEDQVRELAAVLREFESGILGIATKVGGAREKVQEVMLGSVENVSARSRRYDIL